ncbi:MAG TPA: hypothetical protein VJ323_22990, partial [Bryobacteraceae bacterium]|nr:hypothetical protein [Bryobacteraceae bacterium]
MRRSVRDNWIEGDGVHFKGACTGVIKEELLWVGNCVIQLLYRFGVRSSIRRTVFQMTSNISVKRIAKNQNAPPRKNNQLEGRSRLWVHHPEWW